MISVLLFLLISIPLGIFVALQRIKPQQTTNKTVPPITNTIILNGIPQEATVSSTFSVHVLLETKNSKHQGGKVVINFDPKILQVIDAAPKVEGIQNTHFAEYDTILSNTADNNKGVIILDVSTKDKQRIIESPYVGTITFQIIGKGSAPLYVSTTASRIYSVPPASAVPFRTVGGIVEVQ